jgi:hypothetical protein
VALFKFIALESLGFVACPDSPVLEDDGTGHSHVEGGGFVCVLGDIDEVVTHLNLVGVHACAFVSKNEEGVAFERHLLDRLSAFYDLNSTD